MSYADRTKVNLYASAPTTQPHQTGARHRDIGFY